METSSWYSFAMGQDVSIQAWKMKSCRCEVMEEGKTMKDGEQVYRYYKLPMVRHGIFNMRSTDSTDLWNAISGVPTCWIDMTCQGVGTPSANRSTRASISSLFLTFIQIHAHQVPYGMFWSLMRNSQLGFIVIMSGQWSGKEWHPLEPRRVTPGAMTA